MKLCVVMNCGLYSKTGKWALSRKRDKFFKFRICSKMEYLTLSYYNFVFKKKSSSCLIKCWLYFILSTFNLDVGRDPKNPVFQFVPISNNQC